MIRTSESHEQLDAAFAAAQAKFDAAVKSSQNPAFRSKYADISSVIDATLEHLNAQGIGVRQHPSLEYKTVGEGVEAYITITTRLAHKSGQWEESDLSIPAVQRDRFDAQSCGSAMTYACRYALQGIFCVRRDDDDANSATGRGTHDAAQDVAREKLQQATKSDNPKVRATAEEGLKKLDGEPKVVPKALFFTYPKKHEGNFAEFFNLKEYASALSPEMQVKLQTVFQPFLSKSLSKTGVYTVPKNNMEPLLAILAGDYGIELQELRPPAREPGIEG